MFRKQEFSPPARFHGKWTGKTYTVIITSDDVKVYDNLRGDESLLAAKFKEHFRGGYILEGKGANSEIVTFSLVPTKGMLSFKNLIFSIRKNYTEVVHEEELEREKLTQGKRFSRKWNRIQAGMKMHEVYGILDEPTSSKAEHDCEVWIYEGRGTITFKGVTVVRAERIAEERSDGSTST